MTVPAMRSRSPSRYPRRGRAPFGDHEVPVPHAFQSPRNIR
jgi:hypothetical protein